MFYLYKFTEHYSGGLLGAPGPKFRSYKIVAIFSTREKAVKYANSIKLTDNEKRNTGFDVVEVLTDPAVLE